MTLKLTTLALALAAALPTQAADPKLQPGMTPEQLQDFNRIAVKVEAMEDARDESGLKGLKISGYADVNYVYNVNKERGGFQFLVPNDSEPYGYDNSYFGTIALDVLKETEGGTKYHLTLIPKRGIGDFMSPSSIVHEATVSIPMGGDVKLFAGLIPDWQGYEYVAPTLNKLISHNLLFDFTLPFGYTGAGLEFGLGDVAMKAAVVNVNSPIRNVGESIPSLAFRGDYEVSEYLGFGFGGLVGPKTNFRADDVNLTADPTGATGYDTKDTLAATIEADFWYTRGDLTLNGQLTYGQQEKAAIAADANGDLQDARWYGASVLAAYKLTPRLEGIVRADLLMNEDNGGGLFDWTFADGVNGIGPANGGVYIPVDPALPDGDQRPDWSDPASQKGANRYAVTVGLNYALNENATFKLEYRYDGATEDVFVKNSDGSYVASNSLISTGIVVFF